MSPYQKSKTSEKAGLPPGTLIHIGNKYEDKIHITYMEFTEKDYEESVLENLEGIEIPKFENSVRWINIDGAHDPEVIKQLGDRFNLHPLLQEDLLNTTQRPKTEEFDNCTYLCLKMLGISKKGKIKSEHLSLILGEGFVISIQERRGDVFDGLRTRIRENKGTIRKKTADFLFYRLMDTVVDYYFIIVEYFSDHAESIEKSALENPDDSTLLNIQKHKKQIINLRRNIGSLREAVFTFNSDLNPFIKKDTSRYLKDVYQHILQVNESMDSYREIVSGLMDLYLSGVSNRMNKVMQVLTIIATIFIPLTFIAGIYGMNFENMPELSTPYAYPIVWGVMIAIFIGMMFYFRKKGWL